MPKISDEELIEELYRLADKLGHPPKYSDMTNEGSHGASTYERRFGSWSDALGAADLKTYEEASKLGDEQLLSALAELGEDLGQRPTSRDMLHEGPHSVKIYEDRFGCWANAVEKAGFERPSDLTNDELLKNLRELGERLDRTPTQDDMNELGPHGHKTYDQRFGSWNDGLKEAGFTPNDYGELSETTLREDLKSVAKEMGRPPTRKEYTEYGKHSGSGLEQKFGTWRQAQKAAGLNPIPSREELLDGLRSLSEQLEKTPTADEMHRLGQFTPRRYQRQFETWNAAVKAVGLEPNPKVRIGPANPNWEGGPEPYGKGWNEQKREDVRERDGRECRGCGKAEEQHLNEYGRKLSVHHIVPARQFEGPERRNAKSNLISLCVDCHRRWEGIPLRPQTASAN